MGPNQATFLNLRWGLKEGLLGYPFGKVDYGKDPVGGISIKFYTGRLRPEIQEPLTFLTPFLTGKIPLSYTFYGTPFTKLV